MSSRDVAGDKVTLRSGRQSITFCRNHNAIVRVTHVQIDSADAELFKGVDIRLIE